MMKKKREQESSSSIAKTPSSKTTEYKENNTLLNRATKLKYGMSYDVNKVILNFDEIID